ncbi:MAG: ABC transporter permease [Cyanobacteria bacterium SIG30]|nr:ABC transporter permease [Cyanobacteria bacterium SIG30]
MTAIEFKKTLTWKFIEYIKNQNSDFLITLGNVAKDFINVSKYVLKFEINKKILIEQCSRYAIDSLPITLTIVSMTAIILAMQIAPELVKQGGGDYMGMASGLVMVREMGAIMAGFAIISMIGSSFASELASMSVTEQISAMKVLRVDPIKYLVVPRFLAGVIMMPFVVTISSFVGLIFACVISKTTAGISYLNFFNSLWHGLYVKDIMVTLLKSSVFGGTISLISCTCGYSTRGGAKEVGISTTKAVVWSFLGIAIWDFIFASIFYM